MSAGVTLKKFKGHEVPDEVLQACLLAHSTAFSAAWPVPAAGKVSPYVATVKIELSQMENQLEGVKKFLAKMKDKDVLMHFSTSEGAFVADEQQPFTILVNAEKKNALVLFAEGLEDPMNTVTSRIVPKCNDLMEMAGFNFAKLADNLKKPHVSADFGGMWGEHGNMTFVMAEGEDLHFGAPKAEGDPDTDFEWGWTTQGLQEAETPIITEKPAETTPEISEEEAAMAELMGTTPAKVEAPAPAPAAAAAKPASTARPGTAPTARAAPAATSQVHKTEATARPVNQHPPGGTKEEKAFETWTPKAGMRQKDLAKLILERVDVPPKDWWTLYQAGKLSLVVEKKAHKDFKSAGEALKNSTTATPAVKDTTTKHVPVVSDKVTKAALPAAPATVKPPVLEVEARDNVIKALEGVPVATVDLNSADIISPTLYKPFEDKYPNIAEQLGLVDLTATYGWDDTVVDKIIAAGPDGIEAIKLWALWLKNDLIKLQGEVYKRKPATSTSTTQTARPQSTARAQTRRAG